MWVFMHTCYILSALSFLLLLTTGLQGFLWFYVLNANHSTFALLAVIVYLFTETLIIFFFVGTGVSIKEYVAQYHKSPDFHKRSIAIKRYVYPPMLLNMLLVMVLFITGGAVDTKHIPRFVHGLLFYICLAHFLFIFRIQHRAFKENTSLILDMSGVSQ